jgi:hydrogenase maturation protease
MPATVETAKATLVLGIGNTLLSDEGVGVRAMQALAQRIGEREDVSFLDGGTLSFTLAGPIAEHGRLIVIDAAELNAAPGTVAAFEGEQMDAFLNSNRKRSVHEVGLMDLLGIATLEGLLPAQRALIAVQPQAVDWGEALTPAVDAALETVVARGLALIERWQG